MSTQTRAQIQARYDRLLKRVKTVTPSDAFSREVVAISAAVLEMYPISSDASPSLYSIDDVEELVRTMLPSPSEVFTDSFFRKPLFPIATLHDAMFLYGYTGVSAEVLSRLGLTDDDRRNKSIVTHVWLALMLDCNDETIGNILKAYKASRNVLTSTTPSSGPTDNAQSQPLQHRAHSGSNRSAELNPVTHEQDQGAATSPQVTSELTLQQESNDSRKATSVFQYFKDTKFSGDLSQSIELTIRDYNVCARQHKLSLRQKADFFVNALADPARTFFFNNARDDMTFSEMAKMMIAEYNSDSRQLQVQGMLETLRLDKFMVENNISSHGEGLSRIIDAIERLTPQCQPHFRSDANKINYLRKAVLGFPWALAPIGNIITAKYTFNAFVTALREHLQLESEMSHSSHDNTRNGGRDVIPSFHQHYGRHPRAVRKHGPATHRSSFLSEPPKAIGRTLTFEECRKRGICFRCQRKWDPGHRCAPGAIRSNIRDRMRNGETSVHIVHDLVEHMEEESVGEVSQDIALRDNDEPPTHVHHASQLRELEIFDQLSSAQESEPETRNASEDIETADKIWFTSYLGNAMGSENSQFAADPPTTEDF